MNLVLRVRRNLFYRYFGLGPDTVEYGESSYTRLFATANARVGWNVTLESQPGALRRAARGSSGAARHLGLARNPGPLPGRARARRLGLCPRWILDPHRHAPPGRLLAGRVRDGAHRQPGPGPHGRRPLRPARLDRARARARAFVLAGRGARLLDAGLRHRRALLRPGEPRWRRPLSRVPGRSLHRHGRLGGRGRTTREALSDPHLWCGDRLAHRSVRCSGSSLWRRRHRPGRTCASRGESVCAP